MWMGVAGGVLRGCLKGWVGSRGPLAHVGFCVELLQLIEDPGDRAKWMWAPSHVGLEGYEVANSLAVEGMCQSPLCSVVPGKTLRFPRVGVTRGRGAESQSKVSFESCSDVVSAGQADFEDGLPEIEGHNTDYMSTRSFGLSKLDGPMPPHDHIVCIPMSCTGTRMKWRGYRSPVRRPVMGKATTHGNCNGLCWLAVGASESSNVDRMV